MDERLQRILPLFQWPSVLLRALTKAVQPSNLQESFLCLEGVTMSTHFSGVGTPEHGSQWRQQWGQEQQEQQEPMEQEQKYQQEQQARTHFEQLIVFYEVSKLPLSQFFIRHSHTLINCKWPVSQFSIRQSQTRREQHIL